jgi:hypothetical protein
MSKSRRKIGSTDIYHKKNIYFQPEGGLQIQVDDVLWPRLGLWQASVHHQLKGQAHIRHLLFKNLRMREEYRSKKGRQEPWKCNTPSIISSKARLTVATFFSKTCACAVSSKKVGKSLGSATLHPSSAQRPGSHWPPSRQKPAHVRSGVKRSTKALVMQHSIHHQLKGQAHIGHLLVKNLRMCGVE